MKIILTESQKKLAKSMTRQLTSEQKKKNIIHQKISIELFNFSQEAVEKFDDLFFPAEAVYNPPGTEKGGEYGTYNYYALSVTTKDGNRSHVTLLIENSYDNFMERLTRFKELKVYL